MTVRTSRKTITFTRPFSLSAIDEVQSAGTYTVETDRSCFRVCRFRLPAHRDPDLPTLAPRRGFRGAGGQYRSVGAASSPGKRCRECGVALPSRSMIELAGLNALWWNTAMTVYQGTGDHELEHQEPGGARVGYSTGAPHGGSMTKAVTQGIVSASSVSSASVIGRSWSPKRWRSRGVSPAIRVRIGIPTGSSSTSAACLADDRRHVRASDGF